MEGNIAVAVNSTTVSSPTLKDSADQDVSVSLATIIILSLINSASSVIGTLGNLLVIAALVNDRRLRSSTDYFIASLSVADLLVTSLYQPLSVFRLYFFRTLQEHGIFRGIMGFVGFLSALASVTSMFVITIDRLVSIVKPLRYETLVTKRVTGKLKVGCRRDTDGTRFICCYVKEMTAKACVLPCFWIVELHGCLVEQVRSSRFAIKCLS